MPSQTSIVTGIAMHPSPSTADAATLLRQAALRTIQAKRRKFDGNPSRGLSLIPPPPPPDVLDYGGSTSDSVPPSATPSDKTDVSMAEGDKEDGEIPDEVADTTVPSPTTAIASLEDSLTSASVPQPRRASTAASDDLVLSPSAPNLSPRDALSFSHYNLDADHVRPDLAMTAAQLHEAKVVILDLLGWGVPPEFLVDLGLSPQLIVYSFEELGLRLPRNVNRDGVKPYGPPPSLPSSPPVHGMEPAQNTPVAVKRRSSSVSGSSSTPQTSSNFPRTVPVPETVQSTTPTLPQSSIDLQEIEHRRKLELLARRAVLQSRKAKQAATKSATAPPTFVPPSPSTKPPVDVTAVEDFLKEVEREQFGTAGEALGLRTMSPEPLEVDAEGNMVKERSKSRSPAAQPQAAQPQPLAEVQPSPDVHSSVTSLPSTPVTAVPQSIQPPKRGTKRPVAADFTDEDRVPSRSGSVSATPHHYGNGNTYAVPKRPTFLKAAQKPVVIDLSDTDDSADEGGHPNRPSSHLATFDSSKPPSLPVTPSSTPRPPSGTSTPRPPFDRQAQLDLEMKRIREQIALRQALRKKKQAIASPSPSTTPVVPAPSSATGNGVVELSTVISETTVTATPSPGPTNTPISTSVDSLKPEAVPTESKASRPLETETSPTIPTELKPSGEDDRPTATTADVVQPNEPALPDFDEDTIMAEPTPPRPTEPPEMLDKMESDGGDGSGSEAAVIGPYSLSSAEKLCPHVAGFAHTKLCPTDVVTGKSPSIVQEEDQDDAMDLASEGTPPPSESAVPPRFDRVRHRSSLVRPAPLSVPGAQVPATEMQPEEQPPEEPKNTVVASESRYTDYESPLADYPGLRGSNCSSALAQTSIPSTSSIVSPGSSLSLPHADSSSITSATSLSLLPALQAEALLPLQVAALEKRDPLRMLCHFEAPGGGTCRDNECEDAHFGEFEPTDDELARYLLKVLPQFSATDLKAALQRARSMDGRPDTLGRVQMALGYLSRQ